MRRTDHRPRGERNRRGDHPRPVAAFSSTEVIIAILVLSVALIPLYQMFVRSWRSTRQSKFSYLALQVAREVMEEARQLPLDRLIEDQGKRDPERKMMRRWLRATGSLFALSKHFLAGDDPDRNEVIADRELHYPSDYNRIEMWLELKAPASSDARMTILSVDVKWEEAGAGTERPSPRLGHFETLLVDHHVERERRSP